MRTGILIMKYLIPVIFPALLFSGCVRAPGKHQPDPGFSRYISSFTAGEISVADPVMIRLSNLPPGMSREKLMQQGIFRIKPSAEGDVTLTPEGDILFKPAKYFRAGTLYSVTFSLGKLTEVEKPFREFNFTFRTITQNFSVEEEGLYTDPAPGSPDMSWKGIVRTADFAEPSGVEKMVSLFYDGRKRNLIWTHSPDRRVHTFMADSLVRDEKKDKEIKVEWDGSPIGVRRSGKLSVGVPGRFEFRVLKVIPYTTPEQKVDILFSDPLSGDQSFDGMVAFRDGQKFTWQVDANRMTLWPVEKITGETALTLYKGIRNTGGRIFTETTIFPLFFSNLKPEVRFLGKGVIVPDRGNLSLPFEAVSLKAIDLHIIQIYASNVRQFLQENQVNGESEIKRVGRLVYKGKVGLNPEKEEDLFRMSTYRIDLEKFIKPEQGSIYRVELRFRKDYSLFGCGDTISGSTSSSDVYEEEEEWDTPGWYNVYLWPRNYNWRERENPCSDSYYTSDRFVSRNIFVSDLGMLAKESKGFRFTFVVTNLNTGLPEEGAGILLFDLQHQPLGSCRTGSNGIAECTLQRKPFVAVATQGKQTGYLRLDDGSSLSVSNFDVSGENIQEGVKGFLYGERGVWRPGDTMYLTFIVDDPEKRLPVNIPVVLRIINPRGQEVEKMVATTAEYGFYHFPVKTRPDDPTGNWYARVNVGGALFEKRLKVETVKPNRLRIELKLPDPVKAGILQTGILQSEWLHGAVASSLKAVVETELFPVQTVFKGYEKFSFDNPAVSFTPSRQTLFEGRLDQNGQAAFPLRFPAETNAPGKLKAWFTVRVFEEGGDFSIQAQQAEFSPYKRYLGIRMPEESDGWYSTGTKYLPELVAVSPEGTPVPLGKVQVSLYKIDWKWWWESGNDNLARYVRGNVHQPVRTWSLNTDSSSVKLDLTIRYHDWNDNGRYLLYARDTENGHATGVTFYVSEWGGWRTDVMPEGATMLSVRTDKEKYVTGEKIRVKFPSSENSHALVSLEDGSRVRDIFWAKTTAGETELEIEVRQGMAPTLYICVTLIQPYGTAQNDAPIRLYGICHVAVEDPETVLHPLIQMKQELEPEKEFSVRVQEKDGKPMTYTLAIVDEGLLDLTGFRTPDPHGGFYAREALGVKTYDLFNYVAGAYGARLERAFAVGGDQELQNAGKKQVSRFRPVVLFAGPFTLRKGASRAHQFMMPSYVGSVKAMVVAGYAGAYGNAEQTARVRTAVMVLTTLPRVAGPGEEITVPVEVFAMKETTRRVSVKLSVNELMVPAGPEEQTVTFTQPGSKIVRFKVKTAGKTGIAKVQVVAASGSESSSQVTELEVRNPNLPVIIEKSNLLEKGQQWSVEGVLPGMAGTRSAYLELSSLPGLHPDRHLDALISYPHGCSEQITSAAFCQLYLENLIRLSADDKQRTEENIKVAIQRLRVMQTGNGGFSLWPGQNAADDWCTSYAGHFLLLASQKGYVFPADMKSRWLGYQVSRAGMWKPATGAGRYIQREEALIQAYRLYTLALAGSPEQGVMNRFREEASAFPEAKWRLAAAYLLSGLHAAAGLLMQGVPDEKTAIASEDMTFGTPLRDKAMILETLLLSNNRQQAFQLLKEIAGEMGSSEWLSTQTSAWCLYALSRYYSVLPDKTGIQADLDYEGKQEKIRSQQAVVRIPLSGNSTFKANIRNTGEGTLHARLISRGTPSRDTLPGAQRNLRIEPVYTDRNGNPLNPALLPQGTDFYLLMKVYHPGVLGKYKNLVLTTIFPSGWEILNSRIQDIPAIQQAGFEYQDVRDDRLYTYFSLQPGETRQFRIALNAAYEGKFFLPAIVAEDMYNNAVYARIPGLQVSVTGR